MALMIFLFKRTSASRYRMWKLETDVAAFSRSCFSSMLLNSWERVVIFASSRVILPAATFGGAVTIVVPRTISSRGAGGKILATPGTKEKAPQGDLFVYCHSGSIRSFTAI